jgi:hypothetical protein
MNAVSTSQTIVRTPLTGTRLLLVRLAWAAVMLFSVTVFLVSLPVRAAELRVVPAVGEPRTTYQLRPGDMPFVEEAGITLDGYALYVTAGEFIFGSGYLIASMVIFWRKSNEWLPILSASSLAAYGVSALYNTNALMKARPEWSWPVYALYAVAYSTLAISFFIFPTGTFVPRWARWIGLAWGIWAVLWVLFPTTPLNIYTWRATPRALLYLGVFGAAVATQVYRFRHVSTPPQRKQTKWVILGIALAFLGFALLVIPTILYPQLYEPGYLGLAYTLSALPLFVISGLFVPLSVTIALLRYRLWETDGLVNRTLAFAALTAALAVIFSLSVFIVQRVFTAVTGSSEPIIPVGVAMLLIGVLFNPTRRWLQRQIDQRFYHLDVETLAPKPDTELIPSAYSGRMLGVYQVGELLGRGGMGEVYRGFHPALNRTVAIKVLAGALAENETSRVRFEREAQMVARLRHPNIVSMFDYGVADSTYYMVMEYVAGQELADYIEQVRCLPLDATRLLLEDVAAALDYAHGQGLVHRDVKPSNVMLQKMTTSATSQRPFRAVLMDFGIAKVITEGTGVTQTGMIGTLAYIAPEQIIAAKRVDRRADIYALGVMAYEMLTGQLPFEGENPAMMVMGHLQSPPPDPREIMPSVSENAAYAILRALSKDPEDRFDSAGEFVKLLR